MSEIITIEDATKILGFKSESESRHWLKWQSVRVTDIARNSFLKRKDLESTLSRIMEKENGFLQSDSTKIPNKASPQPYTPQGKAEKEFYDKLLKSFAKSK